MGFHHHPPSVGIHINLTYIQKKVAIGKKNGLAAFWAILEGLRPTFLDAEEIPAPKKQDLGLWQFSTSTGDLWHQPPSEAIFDWLGQILGRVFSRKRWWRGKVETSKHNFWCWGWWTYLGGASHVLMQILGEVDMLPETELNESDVRFLNRIIPWDFILHFGNCFFISGIWIGWWVHFDMPCNNEIRQPKIGYDDLHFPVVYHVMWRECPSVAFGLEIECDTKDISIYIYIYYLCLFVNRCVLFLWKMADLTSISLRHHDQRHPCRWYNSASFSHPVHDIRIQTCTVDIRYTSLYPLSWF